MLGSLPRPLITERSCHSVYRSESGLLLLKPCVQVKGLPWCYDLNAEVQTVGGTAALVQTKEAIEWEAPGAGKSEGSIVHVYYPHCNDMKLVEGFPFKFS